MKQLFFIMNADTFDMLSRQLNIGARCFVMERRGFISLGPVCFTKQKRHRQQTAALSCFSPVFLLFFSCLSPASPPLCLLWYSYFWSTWLNHSVSLQRLPLQFLPPSKAIDESWNVDCRGTNTAGPIRATRSEKASARQKNDHCVSSAAPCISSWRVVSPFLQLFAGMPACITALTQTCSLNAASCHRPPGTRRKACEPGSSCLALYKVDCCQCIFDDVRRLLRKQENCATEMLKMCISLLTCMKMCCVLGCCYRGSGEACGVASDCCHFQGNAQAAMKCVGNSNNIIIVAINWYSCSCMKILHVAFGGKIVVKSVVPQKALTIAEFIPMREASLWACKFSDVSV